MCEARKSLGAEYFISSIVVRWNASAYFVMEGDQGHILGSDDNKIFYTMKFPDTLNAAK